MIVIFNQEMEDNINDLRIKEFRDYASQHESKHLLNLLISLQLIPSNHGQQLFKEWIVAETIKYLNRGSEGNILKAQSLIAKVCEQFPPEDPPLELFTENLLFHGGNYTIMPGAMVKGGDILNTMIEAVFQSGAPFTSIFMDEINKGITLILELGALIFNKHHLLPNIYDEPDSTSLLFHNDKPSYGISSQEMHDLLERHSIPASVLQQFVFDGENENPVFVHPNDNPLLLRPILFFGDQYFFVLPSCQVQSVNEFIFATALKYECLDLFIAVFQKVQSSRVLLSCEKMGWLPLKMELPRNIINAPVVESIFKVDEHIICYFIYQFHPKINQRGTNLPENPLINQRVLQVNDFLHHQQQLSGYRVLLLNVFCEFGRSMGYSGTSSTYPGDQVIWFSAYEFIHLANSGEWGQLSLWNYAKSYNRYFKRHPLIQRFPIEAYSIYKANHESFYFEGSDGESPLSLRSQIGGFLYRNAKQWRKIHGSLFKHNKLGYHLIERFKDYNYIYKPAHRPENSVRIIETYHFPIWLVPRSENPVSKPLYVMILEAIAVWLERLYPFLDPILAKCPLQSLTIQVELDPFFSKENSFEAIHTVAGKGNFAGLFKEDVLLFQIPRGIARSFYQRDNAADRIIMHRLLGEFNRLPNIIVPQEGLLKALNEYMPLGPATMLLLFNSAFNSRVDGRWIPGIHTITESSISELFDDLLSIIDFPGGIPDRFDNPEIKKSLCKHAVESLLDHLRKLVRPFRQEEILKKLLELHESLIFADETNRVKMAADIAVFQAYNRNLRNMRKAVHAQRITANAARCLIEYIIAQPGLGTQIPGLVEIDEMLAVMRQIINFGLLRDAINFGMDDPEFHVIKHGRLEITNSFIEPQLQPFFDEVAQEMVEDYIDNFDEVVHTERFNAELPDMKAFFKLFNPAASADLGFSIKQLLSFASSLVRQGITNKSSVVSISRKALHQAFDGKGWTAYEIDLILDWWSLSPRDNYLKSPEGFSNEEVFPWKDGREFSLIKRPLAKYITSNEEYFIFGIRCVESAVINLHISIRKGRLKNIGKKMTSLLGERGVAEGDKFRKLVFEQCKVINPERIIAIPYEV